jgi:hypothetical protein
MNYYRPPATFAPAKPEGQVASDLGSAAPATNPNAMESLPAPVFPLGTTPPESQAVAVQAETRPAMQQSGFADAAPVAPQQQPQPSPQQELQVAPPQQLQAQAPPVTAAPPADPSPPSRPGHAEDYSWLCGEVQYDHISKGWRLRYASLDEVDRWGGAVILVADGSLQSLKDGQIIRVRGNLINQEGRKGAPAYRVEAIAIVEGPGRSTLP